MRDVLRTVRAARLLTPARQLVALRPEGSYRLRRGRTCVHVRHRSRDLDIMHEILGRGIYRPPAGVAPLLQSALCIMDLGGNVGLFGVYAYRTWRVERLVSYEPDPDNARLLRATAAAFPTWKCITAAAANHDRGIRFVAGLHSESRAALPGERGTLVPTVDVFAESPATLVKMDIEGGEWAVLADPRLRDVTARVIVLEWHALNSPAPEDAGPSARALLDDAGFTGQWRGEECPTNGLLWAWRES